MDRAFERLSSIGACVAGRIDDFEIGVIGGGIVGMATAMALLEDPARTAGPPGVAPLVVLEAEPVLAAHQTGRNSGVIHSGIYYKPGSLKAKLCAEGREAMYAFCSERGIAHERCGKIIVATHAGELPALEELERRGCAHGLRGVRRCAGEAVREVEPHVAGIQGLFVAETGIVSYASVLREMRRVVEERGGCVRTASPVVGISAASRAAVGGPASAGSREAGHVLSTPLGEVRVRKLINCAGLQCDRIAAMCGIDAGVRIVPFRGEYFDLVPAARRLVRNLIYPVPDARYPFLGVHYTRAVDGTVEAGPNAVLAMARHGYTWDVVSPDDIASLAAFPGFWRMAARHWRTGVMEVARSLSRERFLASMRVLIPEVKNTDIVPGRAGIRAQAVARDGSLIDDFRIVQQDGMIHVLNAPSPAATASIAIGRYIARLVA